MHVIIKRLVHSSNAYHARVALLRLLCTLLSDHMGSVCAYFQLLFRVEGKEAGVVDNELKGPLVGSSLSISVGAFIVVISLELSGVHFDAGQVAGGDALGQRDTVVVGGVVDLVDDVELCLAYHARLNLTEGVDRIKPCVQELVLSDLLRALTQDACLSAL